ncbi:MAG: hypothetical protein GEU75_04340 [Dehalococcoidia bacterium]|nr:hypothetical protein [Dehalococcoidia bacterium]
MIIAAGDSECPLRDRFRLRLKIGPSVRLLLSVTFLLLLAFAARGELSVTAAPGYSFGNENSWIRIQNIGSADANIDVSYFDEGGRIAGQDSCPSDSCPPMYPGSGWTFFQRDNPSLPAGFSGSAVVSTDEPIVALMAKDVFRDGVFAIAGDTIATGPGSHRMYLPATAKRDRSWNGRFVIQNLSDTVMACLTITYLSNATDDEVSWDPYRPPSNGTPRNSLPGCPNGGMPMAPRGSIFRSIDSMTVGDGFSGSVRIDLHRNASNQGPERQFISANADTWNSDQHSFSSYRGFDEAELGNEIVLPLIDREVGPGNSYSTRFQIVNKTPSRPARVTLRFDGYDMSSGTAVPITKTNTMTIKASRMCFQDRDDLANCLAPGDRLPFNFIGTVRLTSNEPIAAVVLRGTYSGDTFTDYRGIRPGDGANRVLLPVLNKNYGAANGRTGWNSWFRVMVADGGEANVTVRYYGLDLPGGSASYTLRVNREFTAFQFLESMLPEGFAGTAIIESDEPIVALANLYTDVDFGDPDMTYNGISLD